MTVLRSNVAVKRDETFRRLPEEADDCTRSETTDMAAERGVSRLRSAQRKQYEIVMWDEV